LKRNTPASAGPGIVQVYFSFLVTLVSSRLNHSCIGELSDQHKQRNIAMNQDEVTSLKVSLITAATFVSLAAITVSIFFQSMIS
jgi:hypothetical protein